MDTELPKGDRFFIITDEDRRGTIWVVAIICLIYVFLLLLLRATARRNSFGGDDWIAVASTVRKSVLESVSVHYINGNRSQARSTMHLPLPRHPKDLGEAIQMLTHKMLSWLARYSALGRICTHNLHATGNASSRRVSDCVAFLDKMLRHFPLPAALQHQHETPYLLVRYCNGHIDSLVHRFSHYARRAMRRLQSNRLRGFSLF